jgi:hypothetical protein
MKMIFLALNALNPDKGSSEFAFYLARLSRSKVYGFFLDGTLVDYNVVLENKESAIGNLSQNDNQTLLQYSKQEQIKTNIQLFKESCTSNEVCSDIYLDHEVKLNELITSSAFADLIVVDAALSLGNQLSGAPSESVKEILNRTACPVIISPLSFERIDELIFTYNGSQSSLFAIKQFTYLFPEYFDKKLHVIQVNKSGTWPQKDQGKFRDWLKNHYLDVNFLALEGNTEHELMSFLLRKKHVFIVMGAYSRNSISQFFNESTAEVLIKTLTQPIFIAHH